MNFLKRFQNNPAAATWLLRLGLAFVFAYAAIDSLTHPLLWESYMPVILTKQFSVHPLLQFFAVVELLVTAWLLSGKLLRFAALAAAVMLAGITVSNLSNFLITFRDVGLIAMALALYALVKE